MITCEEPKVPRSKFNIGQSVSKLGAGTIPGYVVAVAPPIEKYGIMEFWYGVRWADGNEDIYREGDLWLAV